MTVEQDYSSPPSRQTKLNSKGTSQSLNWRVQIYIFILYYVGAGRLTAVLFIEALLPQF